MTKISAAPETYLKEYSQVWKAKFSVCGLDHSGSEPFNYMKHTSVRSSNTFLKSLDISANLLCGARKDTGEMKCSMYTAYKIIFL